MDDQSPSEHAHCLECELLAQTIANHRLADRVLDLRAKNRRLASLLIFLIMFLVVLFLAGREG